jgi:hypothetical protein
VRHDDVEREHADGRESSQAVERNETSASPWRGIHEPK